MLGAIESRRCKPSIEIISNSLELGSIPKQDMYDFVFDFDYVIPNHNDESCMFQLL
jgi:hypothetical protein